MRKIILAMFVGLISALVVVSPAMAHHGSLAVAVDLTNVEVTNFNMGCVSNFAFTRANTGWNHTYEGSSDTGNAGATALVSTNLNSSNTQVAISDFEWGPMAVNQEQEVMPTEVEQERLRRRRHPLAIALDVTTVRVANFNFGGVLNRVATLANSGYNFTYGGSSDTGNASASSAVSTTLNSNNTSVRIAEAGMGPLALNEGRRGGLALAVELDLVQVGNMNMGMVNNQVLTRANTGWNTTNGGTSGTGNANASSTVGNAVNSNSTTVAIMDSASGPVAVNGEDEAGEPGCLGGCLLPTGPVANNETNGIAVAADVTSVEVENTNIAQVTNNVVTLANSGNNTTGCPGVESTPTSQTGNATASTTVSNTVNTNSTTVTINQGGMPN